MDFKNKNIVDAFWCSIEGLKILLQEKAARRELLLFPFGVRSLAWSRSRNRSRD